MCVCAVIRPGARRVGCFPSGAFTFRTVVPGPVLPLSPTWHAPRSTGTSLPWLTCPQPPRTEHLDAVGGDLLTPVITALAPGGRLVAYSSGGGTVQAYDLLVGAKSVIGFQMARIAREEPDRYERWRRELWELFERREVRPAVHAEFALEDAAKAHEAVESRANLGKVVLRP